MKSPQDIKNDEKKRETYIAHISDSLLNAF